MREVFAYELRAPGVSAEATLRQARGYVQKRWLFSALHLETQLDASKNGWILTWCRIEKCESLAKARFPAVLMV
jgi:hypothetical protein